MDMEQINILEQIKNIFSGKTNFRILEHNVDLNIQMEFFETAIRVRKQQDNEFVLKSKDNIFDINLDINSKKELLVGLSGLDKVEAFRTLEKYMESPDIELVDWAKLAIHESRMLIESSLLNQKQVYITTGLGGKDNKFRYFGSFISNSEKLTKLQRDIIKKELFFNIDKFDGEIEDVKFRNNICSITFCVPLNKRAGNFLNLVLDECNVLGNFLNDDFLLTNVKKLTFSEISKITEQKKLE